MEARDAELRLADGLCAINVDSRSGIAVSDTTNWYALAQSAYEIINDCVRPYSAGGVMKNVGKSQSQ